jgi:predicted alpha/beta superfamily hydrolase
VSRFTLGRLLWLATAALGILRCTTPTATSPPTLTPTSPFDAEPAVVPTVPAGAVIHRQVIDNTELRVLPRAANGRDYLLYIGLPQSFKAHPERRYPVLYLCDGYWDFNLVNAFYDNLLYDGAVPEYILVGIGYPDQTTGDERAPKARKTPDYERLRRWDLSPVVDQNGRNPDEWGHAGDFLMVVERELIPFIESNYRGDPGYRVLGGSSLGGLFVLYALFARPNLFNAYIAPSPMVGLGGGWLFKYEEAFAKGGTAPQLKTRLFLTAAEKDAPSMVADIKRLSARLSKRAYPNLTYQFRIIDGERHAGTKAESYNRGVRFAFLPRAPKP